MHGSGVQSKTTYERKERLRLDGPVACGACENAATPGLL